MNADESENSNQERRNQDNESQEDPYDMAYSPYMDLFFPFIIEKEHRLSE